MAEADPGIFSGLRLVPERVIASEAELDQALRQARAPFVVRGLVRSWPLVEAGLRSADEARRYLLRHHRDVPYPVTVGLPGGGARLFYDDTMQMNFRVMKARLVEIFTKMAEMEEAPQAPAIYLASIDTDQFFPGFNQDNSAPLGSRKPMRSIWIGSRTRVAAHNDIPDNLACVAVGQRRFSLFPPDQIDNLYVGPLDNTPAGRAVSIVDFHEPDFDRFPRFRTALDHAQIAELEPGDAVFIPSLWWHHVEGTAAFNALVNYWWRDAPAYLGKPEDALLHAILAIRDLPDADKEQWRDLFTRYVFENGPEVTAHIPEHARGVLAPLTSETAGRLRAKLLRNLSR